MAQNNDIERRFSVGKMELRNEAGKPKTVVGYACRFDGAYALNSSMSEDISSRAFSDIDVSAADVVCLFNHDNNIVLGRTSAGTLRLKVDERGLHYECDLPDSPNGYNIGEAISRGDVKASSWAFTVAEDEWDKKKSLRTITKLKKLYDVSPVTYPANPATDVAARSLKAWAAAEKPIEEGDDEIFKEKHGRGGQRDRELDMMRMMSV